MATKKLAAPAAEEKTTSKAMVSWEEKMAAMAAETATQERVGSNAISLKSGIMSFMGQPVKDNNLDVVVLGSAIEHSYYDVDYDPDRIVPPVCFAVGTPSDDMVPHPDVPEDQRQSDRCATCPKHAFKSAKNGRGRACSVRRRLVVMPADQLKNEDLSNAEVGMLKMPPTSVDNWKKYVNRINALHQRPPFGLVTNVACRPHLKFQFQLHFEDRALIGEDYLDDIYNLTVAHEGMLMAPFDMTPQAEEEEEPPPPAKGKVAAGKKKY
jgi:hypothetical protein